MLCFKMQSNMTELNKSHGPLGLLCTPSTSCLIVSLMSVKGIYGVPALCRAFCGVTFRKLLSHCLLKNVLLYTLGVKRQQPGMKIIAGRNVKLNWLIDVCGHINSLAIFILINLWTAYTVKLAYTDLN